MRLLDVRDSNGVDLDIFPSAMGIITRLACGRAKQEAIELGWLPRRGQSSPRTAPINAIHRSRIKGSKTPITHGS